MAFQCTYLTPASLRSVSRILDAGCGGGYLVRYLDRHRPGIIYVGVDRSSAVLAVARSQLLERTWLISDVQRLPFEADVFDLAYSRDVLIHHPAPYDAVVELYRVARHVVLRIRTAEIRALFTARYRDGGIIHHFFPLNEVVNVIKTLSPSPELVRYRVHRRHPRVFDTNAFSDSAKFSAYFVTDVFISKGASAERSTRVIDDTDRSIFQAVFRRLRRDRSYLGT